MLKVIAALVLASIFAAPVWCANIPLSVSVTIVSSNNCRFTTTTGTLTFGNLDPSGGADVLVSSSLTFVCQGKDALATFGITDDDGINELVVDGNRMASATVPVIYLPYSFSYSPVSDTVPKRVSQTLTLTGLVRGSDYRVLPAGSYSDVVTLTINP